MSEKRFGYGETDLFEWVEYDGEMISTKECVNKLNELAEENEQLRQLYNVYEKAEEVEEKAKDCLIQELKKENEQLRKELNDCEKFRYQVFKRMGELNDE